jgi:hypothetical protein
MNQLPYIQPAGQRIAPQASQQQTDTGKGPDAQSERDKLFNQRLSAMSRLMLAPGRTSGPTTPQLMRPEAPQRDRLIAFDTLAQSPGGTAVKNAMREIFSREEPARGRVSEVPAIPSPMERPAARDAQPEGSQQFDLSKALSRVYRKTHVRAEGSTINNYLNNFLDDFLDDSQDDSQVKNALETLQAEINSIISLRRSPTATQEEINAAVENALNGVNSILAFPQLSFDKDFVPGNRDTVANNMAVEGLKERGQGTDEYLKEFFEQTGLNPLDYGRVVVNMSGEESSCGYRAIFSQVYSSCRDTALAHIALGGAIDLDLEEKNDVYYALYSRIFAFCLTIAVGYTRQYLSDVVRGTAKYSKIEAIGSIGDYLRSQINVLTNPDAEMPNRDGAGGRLGAGETQYLSVALNRQIVVVESSKNGTNSQEGTLRNTNAAINAVTALLHNAQGINSIENMKALLTSFQDFVDGQAKSTVIAITGYSLAMIENNPNLAVKEVKDFINGKLRELTEIANKIEGEIKAFEDGGATVRIYNCNGESAVYNTVRKDDAADAHPNSTDPRLMAQDKKNALRVALRDPKTVCVYCTVNHYWAVQLHRPELVQQNMPA